jgi:hypothetical protein
MTIKRTLIKTFGDGMFEYHRSWVRDCLATHSDATDARGPVSRESTDLVLAKASVAKLRYESESYKVFVRNRDRAIRKVLQTVPWPSGVRKQIKQVERALNLTE